VDLIGFHGFHFLHIVVSRALSEFVEDYKQKWKVFWFFNPFFPLTAYLQMVISWSLRYSDTSFVVMILAKIESPGGKPFSFVKPWDGVFS
jgi:hypothetical protein